MSRRLERPKSEPVTLKDRQSRPPPRLLPATRPGLPPLKKRERPEEKMFETRCLAAVPPWEAPRAEPSLRWPFAGAGGPHLAERSERRLDL